MRNQEEQGSTFVDSCECSIIHEDIVESVRKQMEKDKEKLNDMNEPDNLRDDANGLSRDPNGF